MQGEMMISSLLQITVNLVVEVIRPFAL